MKVQQIGNYNNKYSSNTNQQSNAKNLSFRSLVMTCNKPEMARVIGNMSDVEGVINYAKEWFKCLPLPFAELFRKLKGETKHLRLTLFRDDAGVNVLVHDQIMPDCFGHGKSYNRDAFTAAEEALDNALSGWAARRQALQNQPATSQCSLN